MGALGLALPSPPTGGSGSRRSVVMTAASTACGERLLNHSAVPAHLLAFEVVSDTLTTPSIGSVVGVRVKHVSEAFKLGKLAKLFFKEHQ